MTENSRKPFIAGNWKMHNTIKESVNLALEITEKANSKPEVDVMIAPVFTALNPVHLNIKNTRTLLCAQDCHWEDKGAFTGAVSAQQVKDAGATHIILGHSERRSLFADTNEIVNKKIKSALSVQLTPILCIGETLQQREQNQTNDVLAQQITQSLKDLSPESISGLIIAYEPVWAIGTGKTATPEQAQQTHKFVREHIAELYNANLAQKIRIIYGGSVKPENIKAIMECEDIDGALVGGASLKADSFIKIIDFREQN